LGKAVKIKRYTETKEAMHIEDTQRGELQRRLKCQRLCIAFSSEKVAAAAIIPSKALTKHTYTCSLNYFMNIVIAPIA